MVNTGFTLRDWKPIDIFNFKTDDIVDSFSIWVNTPEDTTSVILALKALDNTKFSVLRAVNQKYILIVSKNWFLIDTDDSKAHNFKDLKSFLEKIKSIMQWLIVDGSITEPYAELV